MVLLFAVVLLITVPAFAGHHEKYAYSIFLDNKPEKTIKIYFFVIVNQLQLFSPAEFEFICQLNITPIIIRKLSSKPFTFRWNRIRHRCINTNMKWSRLMMMMMMSVAMDMYNIMTTGRQNHTKRKNIITSQWTNIINKISLIFFCYIYSIYDHDCKNDIVIYFLRRYY